MALLHLLVVIAFLANHASAKVCTADTDCATLPEGGICTTGAAPRHCNCGPGFQLITNDCKAAGQICTAANQATDCPQPAYTQVCGTDLRCECKVNEAPGGAVCGVKPGTPTLALGSTDVAGDLSLGATYTLACSLASAPVGTTYVIYKGTTKLPSGTLTKVSAAITDGDYTCKAILANVPSDASNTITLKVGAGGKHCTSATVAANCPTANFKATCTESRCVCKDGEIPVGDKCAASTKGCTGDGECSMEPFGGSCSALAGATTQYCDCAATFVKVGKACKVKPGTPTLALGSTDVAGDLSLGATYTLKCSLASAPGGTTYVIYKGTTKLSSGTLTKVSAAVTDGNYTCKAIQDNGPSDASNTITLKVGEIGKYCADKNVCTGTGYAGTCKANRCECKKGYEKTTNECTSGSSRTATLSVLGLVLAFVMSKML